MSGRSRPGRDEVTRGVLSADNLDRIQEWRASVPQSQLMAKPLPNEKPLPEFPGPSRRIKKALNGAAGRLHARTIRLMLRGAKDEGAGNTSSEVRVQGQWRGMVHERTSTEEQRLLDPEEQLQSPSDEELSLQDALGSIEPPRGYRMVVDQENDMSLQDALDRIDLPGERPRAPIPPIPGYLLLGQETRAQRKERKKRDER